VAAGPQPSPVAMAAFATSCGLVINLGIW
jgi:hypothetical protein